MKKCVLVNCFASSNEMRVEPIREVLQEKGYKTIYVSSDYHHALKKYVELDSSITPIHVKPYKKNLSIDRLLAHKEFSKKVYEFLCREQPELIYIKFPPNSLVKVAYEYKKNYDCRVILDLFDLWPESLPVPISVKTILKPILSVWAGYRDKYISCSDLVFTECDMYREVLRDRLPKNIHTLYLTKEDIDYEFKPAEKGRIRLCFLGGINNLIDMEAVDIVVEQLKKNNDVSIDIIGDGINKSALIDIFKNNDCEVRFHGPIFDEKKKYEIMSQCDLGLNLVKNTVKIALSIKSIDYFRAGLGIVNNVPFDTWRIINESKAGINIMSHESIIIDNIDDMKKNARNVFVNLFSVSTNKTTILDDLEKLEKGKQI